MDRWEDSSRWYNIIYKNKLFIIHINPIDIINSNWNILVDGSWGRWGRWGRCTRSCMQTRDRACDRPKPQGSLQWRNSLVYGLKAKLQKLSKGKLGLTFQLKAYFKEWWWGVWSRKLPKNWVTDAKLFYWILQ